MSVPTPSQLLISCMEDFGRSEPTVAIVVYLNQAGDICWRSSTDHTTTCIGMLELTKVLIIEKLKPER